MKQIPIPYSTNMVQAKLSGRKSVTRRIIKHPKRGIIGGNHWLGYMMTAEGNALLNGPDYPDGPEDEIKCPYGKVGDVLYVRETLEQHGELGLSYVADNEWIAEYLIPSKNFPYRGEYGFCNVPSIHMPKELARIWEVITEVKVERLQDISEEDAIAEGILYYKEEGRLRFKDYTADASGYGDPTVDYPTVGLAVTSFCTLWESISGRESWDANPWVWVIRTKILSTTGKPADLK